VSSSPKRITIDAPSEMVILAARHLDATEGRVQVGAMVDSSTRSAITTVLRYIATAHNSPAEPGAVHTVVQGRCPACRGASLFLGDGGHVTCSRLDCPNPTLADEQLHGETGQSDIGEIQVTRQRGRGVVVGHAPARALIGLRIIRDLAWPANIAGVGDPDLVNIADQVLYRVVGYDAGTASLIVELVEDWRPAPTVKLSEADVEKIRSRWRERYGKPGVCNHEPTGGTP
jgi:hypothetical protein